jgi:hypothetical protein
VTLGHTSLLKKICSILTQWEEQTNRGSGDGNTMEVMQVTKISHGELTVKTIQNTLEEST